MSDVLIVDPARAWFYCLRYCLLSPASLSHSSHAEIIPLTSLISFSCSFTVGCGSWLIVYSSFFDVPP